MHYINSFFWNILHMHSGAYRSDNFHSIDSAYTALQPLPPSYPAGCWVCKCYQTLENLRGAFLNGFRGACQTEERFAIGTAFAQKTL